jgi:hypothetical protein
MDQNMIEARARRMTDLAENGESRRLSQELNSMTISDRVKVAQAMEQFNKDDTTKGLPQLEIKFDRDQGGQNHLASIVKVEERSRFRQLLGADKQSRENEYNNEDDWSKAQEMDVLEDKGKQESIRTADALDQIYHSKDGAGTKANKAFDELQKTASEHARETDLFLRTGKELPDSRDLMATWIDGRGHSHGGTLESWDDGRMRFSNYNYTAIKDNDGKLYEFYRTTGLTEITSADGKTVTVQERSGSGYQYEFASRGGQFPTSTIEFDKNDPFNPRKNHQVELSYSPN